MSNWGKGAQNNTIGWGQGGTNSIGYGKIYESSYAGDTALIGTSAAFLYSKSSFNQGEADPTPTITGTAGGSFNASANVVFVDTGTFNSSTGQIDLSATSIGSHIITYTVNGVQSGQTVGVESIPYASTSSFSFDGVNDYFDIGTISSINSASACTISYWAKKASASGDDMTVGSQLTSTNGIWLQWYTDNNVYFSPRNGGSNNVTVSLTGDTNWHHLVGVYDGTNMTIYIDGAQAATSTTSVPASLSATAGNNFQIGALNGSFFTSGNIDEVAVWNSALSSAAITEIYNSGAPNDLTTLTNASNTNLKAWYKF